MQTKNAIINKLKSAAAPLSALDLIRKIKVNKTTIYRSLEKLMTNGVILEIDFSDGKKRYELAESKHHHHLICISCSTVKDVSLDEKFNVPKSFKVVKHNLEFFGYCKNCQ